MNQNHNKLLAEAVTEVLEKVAFLFPMPIEEEMQDESLKIDEDTLCIGITFKGPRTGKLFICLPRLLTNQIAANMLGIEEDEPDVKQKSIDAVKEVLNIICGNLLPKIFGEEPVFNLCTPSLVEEIEKELSKNDNYDASEIKLDVEDNIVTAVFAVKQQNG